MQVLKIATLWIPYFKESVIFHIIKKLLKKKIVILDQKN